MSRVSRVGVVTYTSSKEGNCRIDTHSPPLHRDTTVLYHKCQSVTVVRSRDRGLAARAWRLPGTQSRERSGLFSGMVGDASREFGQWHFTGRN